MTDEERKELCEWLRDPSVSNIFEKCGEAAYEIERLAQELERMKINYKEENLSAQRQWTK